MDSSIIGSIKLMFLVYALAAVISLLVALIIKGIFATVKSNNKGARHRITPAEVPVAHHHAEHERRS